jgi:hypothetical protein
VQLILEDTFCGPLTLSISGRPIAPVNAKRTEWVNFFPPPPSTAGNRAAIALSGATSSLSMVDVRVQPVQIAVKFVGLGGAGDWKAGVVLWGKDSANYNAYVYDFSQAKWQYLEMNGGVQAINSESLVAGANGILVVKQRANGIDVNLPDGQVDLSNVPPPIFGTKVGLLFTSAAGGNFSCLVEDFRVWTLP